MFRFMKSPIGIAVGLAAVILASPKARTGLRKLAVKTVAAFLGAKEQMKSAGSEMEEALPKVKEAARKAAVKTVSPIIGAVEAVPITISKFQEKWASRVNAYHSNESVDYESLPVTP